MDNDLDYDDLVKKIVEFYDEVIQFDRQNKVPSIKQTIRLEHVDRHNEKSASKRVKLRQQVHCVTLLPNPVPTV